MPNYFIFDIVDIGKKEESVGSMRGGKAEDFFLQKRVKSVEWGDKTGEMAEWPNALVC